MRIISGKYRGLTIPSPKEEIVRPTLDRVKENIFNILQFDVPQSNCLDLFCGSGALGLECLSRGAEKVYFVDQSKANIASLEKFLKNIKEKNYNLLVNDYHEALKKFKERKVQFDLIFLDPPYETELAQNAITTIFKNNLLSENGIIIWEHKKTEKNGYAQKTFKTRTYGTVEVSFIRK